MASSINADNGVISGSSGLKSTADASGVLALQTNGTTAVTVDTSQNVGIGETLPAAKLHVNSASAGLMAYFNSTNANGGYISGYSSNTAVWDFGTAKQALNVGGSSDVGINTRSGFLAFGTGTTERFRIGTSGQLGIGGANYGTSGQVLTSGGSGAAPSWATLAVPGTGGSVTSGSQTLTSSSSGAIAAAFTDYGQYIKLPDATTMTAGSGKFTITNTSEYPGVIIDNASAAIAYLPPYTSCNLALASISTAAGTWLVESSMGALPVGIEATLANTTIGANSLDLNNYAFSYSSDGATQETFVLTGGNILIKGTLGCVIYDPATRQFGTPLVSAYVINIAMLDGASAIITYLVSNVIKAKVLTFSGTTITANAEATATAEVTAAQPTPSVVATTATSGVIVYNEGTYGTSVRLRMRGFSISGTTITIGAATAQFGTATTTPYGKGAIAISSSAVLAFGGYTGTYFCVGTLSGSTVTIGTAVSQAGGTQLASRTTSQQFAALGNGKYLFPVCNTGTSELYMLCLSISGTTITKSQYVNGIGITQSSQAKWSFVGTDTATLQFAYAGNAYAMPFQNTTGTTVTASGTLGGYSFGSYYPAIPAFVQDSSGNYCLFAEISSTGDPAFTGARFFKASLSGVTYTDVPLALRHDSYLRNLSDFGIPAYVLSNGSKRYVVGRSGTYIFGSSYLTPTYVPHSSFPTSQYYVVNSSAANIGVLGNAYGIIILGGAK